MGAEPPANNRARARRGGPGPGPGLPGIAGSPGPSFIKHYSRWVYYIVLYYKKGSKSLFYKRK